MSTIGAPFFSFTLFLVYGLAIMTSVVATYTQASFLVEFELEKAGYVCDLRSLSDLEKILEERVKVELSH